MIRSRSFVSKLAVPSIAAVCLLASQALVPAASAAPVRTDNPTHIIPTSGKSVKLTIANSSAEPLKVQIGEWTATIDPGKKLEVKAPVGSNVVNVDATRSHTAGEVLAQVSKALSGATLRVS